VIAAHPSVIEENRLVETPGELPARRACCGNGARHREVLQAFRGLGMAVKVYRPSGGARCLDYFARLSRCAAGRACSVRSFSANALARS
jgi:hypothetical protein